MSGKPSSSSSPWSSGSSGPRSSSRSLAARVGLFLLKLAILVPALQLLVWPYVQPHYSALVAGVTNRLLAAEEWGERVTTLRPAGEVIQVWSTLRDDGQAAHSYNAELLHFYLVLCVAVALSVPEPRGWKRLGVLGGILLGLLAFHAFALLVTVEHTYAVVLAEIAKRNYGPTEAAVYRWLRETFVHFAVQLVPAATLLILVAGYAGFGRAWGMKEPEPSSEESSAPEKRRGKAARIAGWALLALVVAALLTGGRFHMGNVRARQAESVAFMAARALERGDLGQAARFFEEAIAIRPGFLEAHDNLGHALLKAGRSGEAEAAFRAALELDGAYLSSQLGLANALLGLDRKDEAIEIYRSASETNPDRWEPRYNLALSLIGSGRSEEARPWLEETVEMNPYLAMARLELAKVLLRQQKVCEALPHLEMYAQLETDPSHADLVNGLIRRGRAECGLDAP